MNSLGIRIRGSHLILYIMQGVGFEPTKALSHRILSPVHLTGLCYPCVNEYEKSRFFIFKKSSIKPQAGFEPAAFCLRSNCSNQAELQRRKRINYLKVLIVVIKSWCEIAIALCAIDKIENLNNNTNYIIAW